MGTPCRDSMQASASAEGVNSFAQPLQSSVQRFEPVDGYSTFGKGNGGRSNRAAIALKVGMVALACVAVVAISGGRVSPAQGEVELEGGSMKTIDSLLSHIDKVTHDARAGDHQDKNAKEKLSADTEEENNSAPSSVKHGIDHISKALEAAQAAESTMEDNDGEHQETAADLHKKKMIEAKMKALQDQIKNDFQKVTGYGHKAGFLPPVKMPHM